VRAETLEAIRTGDIVAAGEGGTRLNEEFPQRYAKRSLYAAGAVSTAAAASAVAR